MPATMLPVEKSRIVPAPMLEFGGYAVRKDFPQHVAINARKWNFTNSRKVKRELDAVAWAIYVFLDTSKNLQDDMDRLDELMHSEKIFQNDVAAPIHDVLMGGENWGVDIIKHIKKSTCIFGIDVSHGSATNPGNPSIAAVVASVEDNKWTRYAPEVRAQNAGEEMIKDLEDMVRKLLVEFKRHHGGQLPQHIIIYRDGVSESQFKTVKSEELQKFKNACDRKIKITLIVVQKRHHTRFFAEPKANEIKNMDPGTVVSSGSGVCQTRDKDFYLCSHECGILAATSRPAHYTVLHNEIGFSLSEIEDLTNSLCYCFGRATKAVSIPAPVYYAHVAAEHYTNLWIRGIPDDEVNVNEVNEVGTDLRDTKKPFRMFYI